MPDVPQRPSLHQRSHLNDVPVAPRQGSSASDLSGVSVRADLRGRRLLQHQRRRVSLVRKLTRLTGV